MTALAPFVILGLPRSRTAWVSHFLSYGGHHVGHDVVIECNSIGDFLSQFWPSGGPLSGSAETGAMLGWKVIRHHMPGAKLVLIRRDPFQAHAALERALAVAGFSGIAPPIQEILLRNDLLDAASQAPGVKSIRYEELADEACCKWLFEHCLEIPFDQDHWERLRHTNIQVDMQQRLQLIASRQGHFEKFRNEVVAASAQISGGSAWAGLN